MTENAGAAAHGMAGSIAASVALALTYPLTTLTARQQIQDSSKLNPAHIKPTLEGLYVGLRPAVVGTFVTQGVYFFFYELFVAISKNLGHDVTVMGSLTNATLAGITNVLLTNPVWLVVTRMQTFTMTPHEPQKKFPTFAETILEIANEKEGILAFWKGVVPSLILVSNPAITSMVYEPLLAYFKRIHKGEKISSKTIFWIAALAKLVATLITFPVLVMKTRLQSKRKPLSENQNEPSNVSIEVVIKEVLEENGGGFFALLGFYKGLRAKVVQTVLNAALMYMFKDRLLPVAMFFTNIGRNHNQTLES